MQFGQRGQCNAVAGEHLLDIFHELQNLMAQRGARGSFRRQQTPQTVGDHAVLGIFLPIQRGSRRRSRSCPAEVGAFSTSLPRVDRPETMSPTLNRRRSGLLSGSV